MAKKVKSPVVKKVVGVALVLIGVQLVFLFLLQSDKPTTIREALEKQADAQPGLSPRERQLFKLQLALHEFIQENGGAPPASLRELTPKYFDSVPIDPNTGKEFVYKVKDNRPYVGEYVQALEGIKPASGRAGGANAGQAQPASESDARALIATLSQDDSEQMAMIYDPAGKRDPFLPFNFAPEVDDDPTKTELEKYSLGQLRLTAVLEGDEPAAIVENNAGRGFTVKKGTKIGLNSGEVVEIQRNKLLILETATDFTGETTTRTVELNLRTKAEEGRK